MSVKQNSKIAYILHRFPVLSETFVIDEISGIKKSGIDISIFSFEKSVDKVMHEEAESLRKDASYALNPKNNIKIFVQVLIPNLSFFLASPFQYSYCFFERFFKIGKKEFLQMFYLGHLIRKKSVQHLHAHFAGLGATAAMLLSRFLHIPFSFTVHAHDIFVENDFLEEKLKQARYIIAISNYNKDYLLRHYPDIPSDKIKVVHCGVDAEIFKPQPKIEGGEEVCFLSGGRLVEKKGFIYLIKACKLLDERGVKFRGHIFGDGPLREALLNEVKELGLEGKINFKGAVDRKGLIKLLAESDLFILPSIIAADGDREGIPVSLMEAMSCQKAVVSTNISGIPELIDSMKNGILVPEKDIEALALAMEELIKKRELREGLGLEARKKIIDQFNIYKTVMVLCDLFKGIDFYSHNSHCNLCGGSEAFIVSSGIPFDQIRYNHLRCKKCGLIYAEPMPRFSKEALSQMAINLWHSKFLSCPDKFDWKHFERSQEHNRLKIKALEKYKKGDRLLEVGCGNGYFLATAQKMGWKVFGVEVCNDLCQHIKRHLRLDVYYGNLEEMAFEDGYFDAIYLDNVLEHVPDPTAFLKESFRVLRENGVIFVSVPNAGDFISELRRIASYYLGIKGIWKGYLAPPMHLYAYSPITLKKMVEKCGFKVLRLFTIGQGDEIYYPDHSETSLKKLLKRLISLGAVLFKRGVLVNVYAAKDSYAKV